MAESSTSSSATNPKENWEKISCPGDHQLFRFRVCFPNGSCNLCNAKFTLGELVLCCRECDFDACNKCTGPLPVSDLVLPQWIIEAHEASSVNGIVIVKPPEHPKGKPPKNTLTGELICKLDTREGTEVCGVNCCAFTPDGKFLCTTTTRDNCVQIWDLQSREITRRIGQHDSWIKHCDISADGALMATSSWDATAEVFDMTTGSSTLLISGHSREVVWCGFSPDRTKIASAGKGGFVFIHELSSGRLLRSYRIPGARFCVFSPDGSTMATGASDGLVKIWSMQTSRSIHVLEGHTYYAVAGEFSRDGSLLATASWDSTARIWDTATGACRGTLIDHKNQVTACSLTLDAKLLATSSGDGTAKIWDVATLECLATIKASTRPLHGCSFSPDNSMLAIGGEDGFASLWSLRDRATKTLLFPPATGRPEAASSTPTTAASATATTAAAAAASSTTIPEKVAAASGAAVPNKQCGNTECANVGKKKCGACRGIFYCSQDCQAKHWPVHKLNCKKI